jgi:hypothetical protein
MDGDTEYQKNWIERLRDIARSVTALDLTAGTDKAAEIADWPPEHWVPAEAIRRVLLDPDLNPDPQGLQIRGVLVTGTLNLKNAILPCRLEITQSRFESIPELDGAVIAEPDLTGCSAPGLSLQAIKLTRNVVLGEFQASGTVNAHGARIGGQLVLEDARLANPGGVMLSPSRAPPSPVEPSFGACRHPGPSTPTVSGSVGRSSSKARSSQTKTSRF